MKNQFLILVAIVLLFAACADEDVRVYDEDPMTIEQVDPELVESTSKISTPQLNLEQNSTLGTANSKKANTEINRNFGPQDPFLDDGSGIPPGQQDCWSYRPRTAPYTFCAFKVYYNLDVISASDIPCVRKEYFENNPDLRLVNNRVGIGYEWWVFANDFDCGPTNGSTPTNGSNQDASQDGRVCVRKPCD